jgi:glycerophosphoryl diester phosphodiesterase
MRIFILSFNISPLAKKPAVSTMLGVHRGGSPENTLLGIARSIAQGAEIIEIDIRLTKDKQLVLLHDATVDRTTPAYGPCWEFLAEELLALEACEQSVEFKGLGVSVPLLSQVMDRFANCSVEWLFDFKEKEAAKATKLLLENYPQIKYMVGSAFDDVALQLHYDFPDTLVMGGVGETFRLVAAWYSGLFALAPDPLHDIVGFVLVKETRGFWSRSLVQALQQRGARVLVCGELVKGKEATRARKWGVDIVLVENIS